jgi:hypothetical protein
MGEVGVSAYENSRITFLKYSCQSLNLVMIYSGFTAGEYRGYSDWSLYLLALIEKNFINLGD